MNINDPFLQFFHHYKAQTQQFSVKFQTGPSILHTLLHPERHRLNISPYDIKTNCGRISSNMVFQVIVLTCTHFPWPNHIKEVTCSHIGTLLDIVLLFHAQSTDQYSGCQATHAGTAIATCGGAQPCMMCSSSF
jgi:hypothetical protein